MPWPNSATETGCAYVWIDWEDCNRTDNISETILLPGLLSDAF
jgi:hypothetical protein